MENTEQTLDLAAQEPQAAEPQVVIEPQVAPVQTDWTTHLVEATEGRIKDVDTLKKTLQERSEYEQKARDLEAKFSAMPERAKRLAELEQKGATPQEMKRWFDFQDVNLSALSDKEKLVSHLSFEFSSMSEQEIKEYIEEKYGEDDSRSAMQKMEYLKAVKGANDYLQTQIVAASNPESIKQANEREATKQQFIGSVQQAFTELAATPFLTSFSTTTEGIEGELKLPIPQDVRTTVLNDLKNVCLQSDIDPRDEKKVSEIANGLLWYHHGAKMVESARKDAYAKGQLAGVKENAGAKFQPSNAATATEKPKAWFDGFTG